MIKNVLDEHFSKYGIDIPNRYNIKAERFLLDAHNEFGQEGFTAINNVQGYADEIIEKLTKNEK